jgi:hypothetical protein
VAAHKTPPKTPRKTAPPRTSPGLAWLSYWPQPDLSTPASFLRPLFWGIAALALVWMVWTGLGTGINGDDRMQNEYEQALMNWYSTGGRDTTALHLPKTKMHYYGGLFEVLSGTTNRLLGNDSPEQPGYHRVRHVWNALFGWAGLLFVGLTAGLLGGRRMALLALLMAFLSPRLVGHGVMNPKDIPFATGYIMSLYFILRWLRQMPRPHWTTLLGLTLSLGVAVGVRAGGLVLVAIFGLFAVLHFIGRQGLAGFTREAPLVGRYAIYGLIPVLGGVLITLAFWPFALQSPVSHIRESLAELSNYGVNIRLLFNGDMVFAQSLPWDYLPRWVLVTVPLFVLLGWLLGLALLPVLFRRFGTIPLLMLGFSFLFPFIYVIYKDSTLYDGWRHLIFPYMAGLVLAAMGMEALAGLRPDRKWLRPAVWGLAGLLAVHPLWHMVRNPFLQYVYFNPLQGGVKGALGEYETDYWGVSVRQGLAWLESQGIIGPDMTEEVLVASNFAYPLEMYVSRYNGKVKPVYVRYRQRHDAAWDYGLFQSRFVDGSYLRKGSWPPPNTIHTIDVSGTPVLAIMKNEDHTAFEGIIAQKQNRYEEAISLLERAVAREPRDEVAWAALAFTYMNVGRLDECRTALDQTLDIDPDNITALNYYGLYHANRNEVDAAVKSFRRAIELQNNNFFAYYYLATLELQRGNLSIALEYGNQAVTHNPQFRGAYELVASIYDSMGDGRNAQAYRQAAAQLK